MTQGENKNNWKIRSFRCRQTVQNVGMNTQFKLFLSSTS
uniref:Uncharacterized protein n=1 Tax=Arundo donax TaxID=35708 RepID=A0A0A8ZXM2_ARUDO